MLLHAGWRQSSQWLRRHLERLASCGHDIDILLRADDRMLKDVGLTRGDAQAVARCRVMAKAAAARRNEAMAAASQRRPGVSRKGRTVSGAALMLSAQRTDQSVGLHGTGTRR